MLKLNKDKTVLIMF